MTVNKHDWWESFLLDDLLPTKGGKYIFASNKTDAAEFWASLAEKA